MIVLGCDQSSEWVSAESARRPPPDSVSSHLTQTSPVGSPILHSTGGWRLVPEQRVDGNTELLVSIGWMAVADDGWFAISQSQAFAVFFFNHQGSKTGSLGRRGRGPGEFMSVPRGGWMADTLWVWDPRLGRITLVSRERGMVRNIRLSPPRGGDQQRLPTFRPTFGLEAVYPDSTVLISALPRGPVPSRYASYEGRKALLRVSWDGTIQRLIGWLPRDRSLVGSRSADGMSGVALVTPFYPQPLMDESADGSRITMAIAEVEGPNAGTYIVTGLDAVGDTVFAVRHPFNPERIPDHVADSAVTNLRQWLEGNPLGEAAVEKLDLPRFYTPITDLLTGRDGTVWLHLQGRSSARYDGWLVLDDCGKLMDTVMVGHNARPIVADLENLWIKERDTYDVESLIRYRIERPADSTEPRHSC